MNESELPEPMGTKTVRRARRRISIRAAGGRWVVWLVRLIVWTVLVLAALLLVRQVTAPSAATVVDAALDERLAVDERTWPTDEARDAAVRVVLDTYSLADTDDETDDTTPTVVRPGPDVLEVTQVVEAVTPGRVEIHDQSRATVHLAARLMTVTTTPTEEADDSEEDGEERLLRRRWRWLAVPVTYTDGLVVASTEVVETPPPPRPELGEPELDEVDATRSDETRELGEAIFAALAGESQAALDALTDGTIPRLADDLELIEMDRWQVAAPERRGVQTGTPAQLTALATVTWAYDTGVTVTQTYTVELETNGAGRWQVTDLGPAHPTAQTTDRPD